MARLIVLAVFDRALGAYGRPFSVPARGIGVRAFGDEVNNPNSEYGKHPADYELWTVGCFNDELGEFEEGIVKKERISLGSDLLRGEKT